MVVSTPLVLLALLHYVPHARGKRVDFRAEVFKEGKLSHIPEDQIRDGNDTTCYEVHCGPENALCSVRIVLVSPTTVSRARVTCSPEPHSVYYVHKEGNSTVARPYARNGNVLDYGGGFGKKVLTIDIASIRAICEVEIFDDESAGDTQTDKMITDGANRSVLYTVLPITLPLIIVAAILATYFYRKRYATGYPARHGSQRRHLWRNQHRDSVPYDDGKTSHDDDDDDPATVYVYNRVRFWITSVGSRSDGTRKRDDPATARRDVAQDDAASQIEFANNLLQATAEYEEVEDLASGGPAPVYATVNRARRPPTPERGDGDAAPVYSNCTDRLA